MATRKRGGIAAVTKKLEASVEAGDYYHAQQMYKTLYFRYSSQKDNASVCTLLVKGACLMLQHDQLTNGLELGLLLIQHFKDVGAPVDNETTGHVIVIFEAFPLAHSKPKRTFVKNALSWSSSPSNNNQGSIELHKKFSAHYRSIKEYALSEKHYLRSSDPLEYKEMLFEWVEAEKSTEPDLFLARAVFQYLCLSNLKDANILFRAFMTQSPIETNLTTFLQYLLRALEYDGYELVAWLTKSYSVSLQRDPLFMKYMGLINKIYYQVGPSEGLGGLMGSLLKSFTQ